MKLRSFLWISIAALFLQSALAREEIFSGEMKIGGGLPGLEIDRESNDLILMKTVNGPRRSIRFRGRAEKFAGGNILYSAGRASAGMRRSKIDEEGKFSLDVLADDSDPERKETVSLLLIDSYGRLHTEKGVIRFRGDPLKDWLTRPRKFTVMISAGVVFQRVDSEDRSTGGKSSLISDPGKSLDIAGAFSWNRRDRFRWRMSLKSYRFKPWSGSGELSGESGSLLGFAVEEERSLNSRLALRISIAREDRLFTLATGDETFGVEKSPVPSVGAGFRYRFWDSRRFAAEANGGVSRLLSTSVGEIQTESGWAHALAVRLETPLSARARGALTAAYGSASQSTRLANYRSREATFGILYEWGF